MIVGKKYPLIRWVVGFLLTWLPGSSMTFAFIVQPEVQMTWGIGGLCANRDPFKFLFLHYSY